MLRSVLPQDGNGTRPITEKYLTWHGVASRERVTGITMVATANWAVVDCFTAGAKATCSRARVAASLVDAGFV